MYLEIEQIRKGLLYLKEKREALLLAESMIEMENSAVVLDHCHQVRGRGNPFRTLCRVLGFDHARRKGAGVNGVKQNLGTPFCLCLGLRFHLSIGMHDGRNARNVAH